MLPDTLVIDALQYIKDVAPVIFVIGLWWWERRRRERTESKFRVMRSQDRIYFLTLVVAVYGQLGELLGVKDEHSATLIKSAQKEQDRLKRQIAREEQ